MEYSPLFNGVFTVITKNKLDFELPSKFINVYGSNEEVSFAIQNYQIQNDEAYSGHFIIDNLEKKKAMEEFGGAPFTNEDQQMLEELQKRLIL